MTEEEQGEGSTGNKSGALFSDSGCHKGVGKGLNTGFEHGQMFFSPKFPKHCVECSDPFGVHPFGQKEQADFLGGWRPRCTFSAAVVFRRPK